MGGEETHHNYQTSLVIEQIIHARFKILEGVKDCHIKDLIQFTHFSLAAGGRWQEALALVDMHFV